MQQILDILLPITISTIMLGIGMGLSAEDFKKVFQAPKAISYGLFGQMIILPIVAIAIAYVFPLEPVHQLGLLLIAICPGGTSSNIVTYMLKGEVALSVSLTTFNSFLIVITIPLFLEIGFYLFDIHHDLAELSLSRTFKEVFVTVLIPVLAGVTIQRYFPSFTAKLQRPLRYILPSLLFLVFSLVLFVENQSGDNTLRDYFYLLVPALLLNFLVIIIGFYSSKMIGLTHKEQYTIAIEMGLQNSALAIYLANNVLKVEKLSLIAVLYGGFSFFTTLLLGIIMKNRQPKV